jgi:mannose-6-phosphate isomerase-like protein (cupin superfamily)
MRAGALANGIVSRSSVILAVMIVINRDHSSVIKTRHGSELRPLIDRTTSGITQCSLAEEVLPPGRAVTPHHHNRLEEIYYIISGHGQMTVGEEMRDVGAGDAVYVPRGQTHSLENTGADPIRLLVVCGPAFYYEDEIIAEG